MRNVLACGTVVLACIAAPAFAQSNSGSAQRDTRAHATINTRADETFVTKAAQGGMAEVELGRLAAERASSPDVKNFAQRMVDDHSKANEELRSIASQKNITLPSAMSAKDKADYNRFSKMRGAAFDRAYMQHMVADHRTDISEFQYESRAGQDNDVRGFASKHLPTLQEHLKMAETTNGAVATTGRRAPMPAGTTGSNPR